jgi:hypothetical protein
MMKSYRDSFAVADGFSCYECDTRKGEGDCVKSAPGRNVSCGPGTVSCYSLYNESTPSIGEKAFLGGNE